MTAAAEAASAEVQKDIKEVQGDGTPKDSELPQPKVTPKKRRRDGSSAKKTAAKSKAAKQGDGEEKVAVTPKKKGTPKKASSTRKKMLPQRKWLHQK